MIGYKLTFLTEDETIISMCTKYWDNGSDGAFLLTMSEIAAEYRLNPSRLYQTVKDYCAAESEALACTLCGRPYIYGSRTDFIQNWPLPGNWNWICEDCQKERDEEKRRQREEEIARKKQILKTTFPLASRTPLEIDCLSFRDAVHLLSFVRYAASEDFEFAWPLQDCEGLFAPRDVYGYEVLRRLFKGGLLFVHPRSMVTAFTWEDDYPARILLTDVMWALPIGEETGTTREVVQHLEQRFRSEGWPNEWLEERVAFWREIALQECLQYLGFTLGKHRFEFEPGEKTLQTFESLLGEYSVAQIYNFIWRAVKDAAAFYIRERVTKRHAANTVVGSIQRQAERARAEGWDIRPYRRDRNCPQSMISEVLYNTALCIGDRGFTEAPKNLPLESEPDS